MLDDCNFLSFLGLYQCYYTETRVFVYSCYSHGTLAAAHAIAAWHLIFIQVIVKIMASSIGNFRYIA